MSEVIDLCDSDEELPSLAARLAQKRGAPLPAGVQHEQPPAARAPLSALHNHAGGSPPAKADVRPPPPASRRESLGTAGQPGGAEELRRRQAERAARKAAREAEAAAAAGAGGGFDAPAAAAAAMPAAPHMAPRPQYHQQEQWQQQQQDGDLGAYLPPAGGSQQPRRPCRGAGTARRQSAGGLDAWQPPSQQQTQLLDDDDWRPSGAGLPGGSRPSSQQQMAGAAGAGGGGKPPPKKRRTKEQIEQDKALQAREKADKQKQKQSGMAKYAMQEVRLLVDAALVSAGAAGASLGVSMLAQLTAHNESLPPSLTKEKRINFAVERLDLAPFKALRWQRRRWVGAAPDAAQAPPPASQASTSALPSQLEERWELEPHVMVCFQPQEFIDAVRADRLAALFALLERAAPGQRPYLLVCGLDRHMRAQDNKEYRADMRAGRAPSEQSPRRLIEEFLAELTVECPCLGFRDVVDAAQAAEHVRLVTAAIASAPFQDSEATIFLRAHDKNDSQSLTNLLTDHPLEDQLKPFSKSLFALPSVVPGVAHVLASQYGSLGGLMDMLLDPERDDGDKQRELQELRRTGGTSNMRVGPAAAKQLLQLLRCDDPGLKVKKGE